MSLALIALAAAVTQAGSPGQASAPKDAAATQIEAFYPVLLDTMKHAETLGANGRAAKLKPTIAGLFNVPAMAQFAVGPRWQTMSAPQQQSIVDALTRYTVRTYAHNFSGYTDETFRVDPHPASHGPDKLVKTTLTSSGANPVSLSYRMREYNGSWKVIDVYYNAVSQVTAQRADFASTLATGGAPALVQKLDGQTRAMN